MQKCILVLMLALGFGMGQQAIGQSAFDSVPVSGNCGMCKKTIETAAKKGGAQTALWSTTDKMLKVSFNSKKTSLARIQEAVAKSGYDTRDVKANDKDYAQLHSCCQYDRKKVDASPAKK